MSKKSYTQIIEQCVIIELGYNIRQGQIYKNNLKLNENDCEGVGRSQLAYVPKMLRKLEEFRSRDRLEILIAYLSGTVLHFVWQKIAYAG